MLTFCLALTVATAIPPHQPQVPPIRPFTPRLLSAFERRKVESLLHDRYPCLGCHQLRGAGGRIGPDLTDVRSRRSAAYVYAMITDPQRSLPGTAMPLVPMTAGTAELIASYLLQGTGQAVIEPARRPAPPPGATFSDDAPALYGRLCAACHGATGRGDGSNAAFLPVRPAAVASAADMSHRSDDALFDTVFAGGFVMNRSNVMPPFGRTLTRDQIWGLVRYIRSLCRCEGPDWSRDNR